MAASVLYREAIVTGLVAVLLMAMVVPSMELRPSHPMRGIVERINQNRKKNGGGSGAPYVGLVMAYPTEEAVLVSSGAFVPSSDIPWVDLAGRRFNIGKIGNVDVIYVMTGEQTVNAAMTVQILVDTFDVLGVVHYGIAGGTDISSLSLGDVSVPTHFALTNSWDWMEFKSETEEFPELKFGDYSLPRKGDNLLAKVEFTPTQLFSNGQPMRETFWLPVEPEWFGAATGLQDLELENCLNETYCLPESPKVVYGLRGATSDVFLENAAYGKFLLQTFNISTVDEESAAVVMTCLSNNIPSIVFRGISDLVGGEENRLLASMESLAAANALSVAVKFVGLFDEEAASRTVESSRFSRPLLSSSQGWKGS